jgi:hypothetical protein
VTLLQWIVWAIARGAIYRHCGVTTVTEELHAIAVQFQTSFTYESYLKES